MRGYNQVFYATNAYLGQIELRQPVALDRRITLALFVDELDYRIRGAYPLLDPYTNRITGYPSDWALYGDAGFGIRFDVPQLGLRTVRIDFAKGYNGTHTSFRNRSKLLMRKLEMNKMKIRSSDTLCGRSAIGNFSGAGRNQRPISATSDSSIRRILPICRFS